MPRLLASLIVLSLAIAHSARARADGGVVRGTAEQGGLRLTVFTPPDPLPAGVVDVSALVQNVATSDVVSEAEVTVVVRSSGEQREVSRQRATADVATNKLLRAALVELPEPGQWDLVVECRAPLGDFDLPLTLTAVEPRADRDSLWPWYGWPLAVVAIFGIHRYLVSRSRSATH